MAKQTGSEQKALFGESTAAGDVRIAQTEKSMLWADTPTPSGLSANSLLQRV